MNNKLIAAIIAVVVVLGGFYFWHEQASAPATISEKQAVHWAFEDKGTDSAGAPQTQVSLNGKVVGTYQGTCSEIDGTSWTLLAGELSGVICYYAGGGKEIGFFANEGGGYDVLEGDIDEGSAETPGVRGNFKTLYTL